MSLSRLLDQASLNERQILRAYAYDLMTGLSDGGGGAPSSNPSVWLKQSLSYHPEVHKVSLTQPGQSAISVDNDAVSGYAPAWLERRLPSGPVQADNGHQTNGGNKPKVSVSVWPNRTWFAGQVWQNFLPTVWVWLLAAVASFGLAYVSFKRSLAGLSELAKTSKSFLTKPAFQASIEGSPEVKKIAQTLNAMSTTMKKIRDVAKSKVELSTWYANHDPLTRLPNRATLIDEMNSALKRCVEARETAALCRFNLDDFQAINKRHGHDIGDLILAGLADHLSQKLRPGDTLARVGGDEFALLMTRLRSEEEALSTLDRFMAELERPLQINDLTLRVSAAVGVSIQEPVLPGTGQEFLDAYQMLNQSSRLMHLAKSSGAKQIRTWRDDQAHVESIEQQWANRLHKAVGSNELMLHYQPKIDIRTGRVIGLEALIRWQHPNLGLLMPGAFLPHVEATDAIVLTGKWAMHEAVRQMSAWAEEDRGWPVSVNVAARQLIEPDFVSTLKSNLASYPNVEPGWLTLEILETSALEDMEHVRGIVESIQLLGVSCSLDDFGTGYSSLTYLKQLPVDEVKIDQSFVRGMLDDNGDLAVVEGVITLCKVFDRQVVAEGVETIEHGAMLHRLGCNIMQGWAIAKAMPASDVPAWVLNYVVPDHWQEWTRSRWSLSHFPVLVANHDLRAWLRQLEGMVGGRDSLLSDDPEQNYLQSRLGSWYQRTGKQEFGHVPGVHELDLQHRALHTSASDFVMAIRQGKNKLAESVLSELRQQTSDFESELGLLKAQVLAAGERETA